MSAVHTGLVTIILISGIGLDPNFISIDGSRLRSCERGCIINEVHPPWYSVRKPRRSSVLRFVTV